LSGCIECCWCFVRADFLRGAVASFGPRMLAVGWCLLVPACVAWALCALHCMAHGCGSFVELLVTTLSTLARVCRRQHLPTRGLGALRTVVYAADFRWFAYALPAAAQAHPGHCSLMLNHSAVAGWDMHWLWVGRGHACWDEWVWAWSGRRALIVVWGCNGWLHLVICMSLVGSMAVWVAGPSIASFQLLDLCCPAAASKVLWHLLLCCYGFAGGRAILCSTAILHLGGCWIPGQHCIALPGANPTSGECTPAAG
jgi:hypothetical protein